MLKNMKLGLKMTLGFGLVILLVLTVGGLAILNMLQIQQQSISLEQEYVPEVEVANHIERSALMLMYDMRAYGLNFQRSFYDQAQTYMDDLETFLKEARQLALDHPKLVQLAKDVEVAQGYVDSYDTLAGNTVKIVDEIAAQRKILDDAAATYISNANAFLESQGQSFTNDISAGAAAQVLIDHVTKRDLTNTMIDLANNARVKTFKALSDFDYDAIASALKDLEAITPLGEELLPLVRQQANINQVKQIMTARDRYAAALQEVYGLYTELSGLNSDRTTTGGNVLEAAQTTAEAGIVATKKLSAEAVAKVSSSVVIILTGLVIALILAVVIAIFLTISIVSALKKGVDFASEIALGNLNLQLDVYQKDEIGVLADALRNMLASLQEKSRVIERIADGDLTVEFQKASDKDDLGQSLLVMKNSLTEILTNVKAAVEQVAGGADQVSQASQELSQGATEQASSLEEITSSVNEINAQSKQNAENATEANGIAKSAVSSAEEGNKEMENLQKAMAGINDSSDQIKKVVKVIDDIAFQINLLALNANVEAARAGKYGKGFAVVAEEVRNLAVKSASAVQETTQMVEDSINNIEAGNKFVNSTADKLKAIVEGSEKVAHFLEEIAVASREQAQGIDQITEGLDQIDQVTQSNTASAEESASASEELAGQADQLQGLVQRFKLDRGAASRLALAPPVNAPRRQAQPAARGSQGGWSSQQKKGTSSSWDSAPKRGETGIRPVDPSREISLDDDDFERF